MGYIWIDSGSCQRNLPFFLPSFPCSFLFSLYTLSLYLYISLYTSFFFLPISAISYLSRTRFLAVAMSANRMVGCSCYWYCTGLFNGGWLYTTRYLCAGEGGVEEENIRNQCSPSKRMSSSGYLCLCVFQAPELGNGHAILGLYLIGEWKRRVILEIEKGWWVGEIGGWGSNPRGGVGGRHQLMMSDIHSSLPGDGRKRNALYTKVE